MKMLKRGIVIAGLMVASILFSGCSIKETWDILWGHNKTESEGTDVPVEPLDPNAVQVDESVSAPIFTQDLEGSEVYAVNEPANELWVEAAEEAEGVVTYQWYVNTVDSNGGGEQINGATESTFTPDTSEAGRYYYFVVATHTVDKKMNLSTSSVAGIIVDADKVPEEEEVLIGWVETEAGWSYYNEGGEAMVSAFVEDGGKKYYMNDQGLMATAWVETGDGWYYFDNAGVEQTGFVVVDGKKYCFAIDGKMRESAWIENDGRWFYATANGALAIEWEQIDGAWYYFNPEGVMRYDTEIDGRWLNPNGKMAE